MVHYDKPRGTSHHTLERYQFVDFEFGDKPIFSFCINLFKNAFQTKYYCIDKRYQRFGKRYKERYFYKPGQEENIRRLFKLEGILMRCKMGSRKYCEYARGIGRLYGYTEEEIETFIKKCCGIERTNYKNI